MPGKSNPSVSIPENTLDKFDDTLFELRAMKKLDRNTDRSKVISELMEAWTEQMHAEYPELRDRIQVEESAEALEKTRNADYDIE